MKKVFLFTLAFCATNLLSAQNFIENNYSHFVEQENVTSVHVSGKMFQFAKFVEVDENDKDMDELMDFIENIESFDLIMVPDLEHPRKEYRKALSLMEDGFEELIRVRDNDKNFSLYVDEDNDVVHEIIGIGSADNKFIVFSLLGDIDLNVVGKVIGQMQAEGLTPLHEVANLGLDQVKVYPNPVVQSGELTIEVPESMIGGIATLYDMNGNLLKSYDVENQSQVIEITGLTTGYYFVEIKKGELVVKKKVAVVE